MDKFTLERNQATLLIIDIQEKLIPGMKEHGERVIKNTNTLLTVAKTLELPVLVTVQYPRGIGNTVADVACNLEGITPYEKTTFSACTEEVNCAMKETGRKKVIITGMETHICVFQTVRELLKDGYEVFVVADAVCSRAKENYLHGLSLMEKMGAVITNTETVLFDLVKDAKAPEFKELSKLIR
ncbi:MAG: hydrolase [Clostridiaceae bacterium]|nr:hydrolase [Clostridiaceae bacterium]